MIHLMAHAEGVILSVRAQPRARKVGLQGETGGALKVGVSAPPEDGKANQALVESIATLLNLRRPQVALFSGATSRDKKFLIRGITQAELMQRLTTLLGG